MIDLDATKQCFEESGRAISKWARAKGFIPGTVSQLLNGAFPATGNKGQEIIKALEDDGLLRFKNAA